MWRGQTRADGVMRAQDGDVWSGGQTGPGSDFPDSEWSPLWTGLARMSGALPPPALAAPDPWALLHPGPDEPLVRAHGGRDSDAHPRFDAPVPPGGYSWWYVDALSDDGRHGLTLIAFIGSVFSPYFKRSGRGNPLDHCALNIALYGPKARWTMTERPEHAVRPEADQFAIGPSSVRWAGDCLVIDIEERDKRIMNPFRRRVAGQIKVWPEMLNTEAFALDPAGKHLWHCIAPRARISVEMQAPELSWKGSAYIDSNRGSESLEEGFRVWHWSRAHLGRDVAVFYEGSRRDGSHFASALRFDRAGVPQEAELPPAAPLADTWWQMERRTRSDRGIARVRRTWEDSPFYTRSTVHARLYGEPVVAMQETLSLDRFCSPVVQQLIPHRMPRAR
ncbi:MAG: hydratase [Novosphingobium sp.]|uniref:hydratase n=1 Tax=Novosphingobium sp. TaxID=1874826 RepID=UPI003015F76D